MTWIFFLFGLSPKTIVTLFMTWLQFCAIIIYSQTDQFSFQVKYLSRGWIHCKSVWYHSLFIRTNCLLVITLKIHLHLLAHCPFTEWTGHNNKPLPSIQPAGDSLSIVGLFNFFSITSLSTAYEGNKMFIALWNRKWSARFFYYYFLWNRFNVQQKTKCPQASRKLSSRYSKLTAVVSYFETMKK